MGKNAILVMPGDHVGVLYTIRGGLATPESGEILDPHISKRGNTLKTTSCHSSTGYS